MRRTLRRLFTVAVVAALVGVPAALPAVGQTTSPSQVTHRQSILTDLSPTGERGESRVFTQLTVEGDGPVEIALPGQSTRGLRNLDGFGRPGTDGDAVIWRLDATPGGTAARTVADHTGDDPLGFELSYGLDGEPIAPQDLVGRSGRVTVTIVIRNLTAVDEEVRHYDGQGRPRTTVTTVAVPLVGSLSTTLDGRFVGVEAPGAAVVGDGRGNTVINHSFVLFPPIGSAEQTLTYSADVVDAIVPSARAQVVPVDSRSFTSLRGAQLAYRDGVRGLQDLGAGAGVLDGNVLLLADGAGQLLDGLVQLRDGAMQLSEGLGGEAVPGAEALSDGMSRARDGAGELNDGLEALSDGAGRLSGGLVQARDGAGELGDGLDRLAGGAGQFEDGAAELAAGAKKLDTGAGQLVDGSGLLSNGTKGLVDGLKTFRAAINAPDGLPAAIAGVGQLAAGVQKLVAGVGDEGTPQTLLNGVAQLRGGLQLLSAGGGQIQVGAAQLRLGLIGNVVPALSTMEAGAAAMIMATDEGDDCAFADPSTCGALDYLEFVRNDGLGHGIHDDYKDILEGVIAGIGSTGSPSTLLGGLAAIQAGAGQLRAGFGATDPIDCTTVDARLAAEVGAIGQPTVLTAIEKLSCAGGDIKAGIDETGDLTEPTLLNGLRLLQLGLDNPAAFTNDPPNPNCLGPADTGYVAGMQPCGLKQGLQLVDGGLGQLDAGLVAALDAINAGLGSTSDSATASLLGGASALSKGSKDLHAGAKQLKEEGTEPLAAGAGRLSAGAEELAAGAGLAANGSGDLLDGLRQLATGGSELAEGAGRAAAGGDSLLDGLGQLDDGAERLAGGLVDAADGSEQIAEGLAQATDGGEQIADGARRLSSEGMGAIIDGVTEAAAGPSLSLAVADAADRLGRDRAALPYGTVDGADATAVFQYDIAGIGGPADGPPVAVLVLATVLAFGAAGAIGLGLRRMLA
jgi:putative membrane protein